MKNNKNKLVEITIKQHLLIWEISKELLVIEEEIKQSIVKTNQSFPANRYLS